MNASWYDVLDVAPDASEDEIKTAWKAAIADLDPTDRRFRVYTQAAEVLLDPRARAAFDAELAASQAPVEAPVEAPVSRKPAARTAAGGSPDAEVPAPVDRAPVGRAPAAGAPRVVPGWLLVVLAAVTLAVVGACGYVWAEIPSDASVEEAARSAQSTAERAVVPILSYDAADLAGSKAAAESYLTPSYREDYAELFAGIIQRNAPATKTVVEAELLASAVVRSGEDRVQVLVLVNQSRTNKLRPEPVVFKNYVTLTMHQVDGEWLVADMAT